MELVVGFYFKQIMKYKNELIKSMNYLAKKPNTLFLGQSVEFSGNAIYNTLAGVPKKKKLEMPVFEDAQWACLWFSYERLHSYNLLPKV